MIRSTLPLLAIALIGPVPAHAAETIPLPHFQSVELRGGGAVVVVPGPAQRVMILEGSSRFTHIYVERNGQLKIRRLPFTMSS